MIFWTDIETTGLFLPQDKLLEVAAVITDDKLVEVARMSVVTDQAKYVNMNAVSPYVQAMHAKNGLWAESLLSTKTIEVAEADVKAFLKNHMPEVIPDPDGSKNGPQLGGSTVNFDRKFIAHYMSELHAHLHYRNLDVSSMNELARRFWPTVYAMRPGQVATTEVRHRALDDILVSIDVARHYSTMLTPLIQFQPVFPLPPIEPQFPGPLW